MILSNLNRIQRRFSSHIILYHSTYSKVPSNITEGLHNVNPDVLYQQISWYKKYFDIVKVDDLFEESSNQGGKVSITFDDGYQSVLKEGIPVIKNLNVPCTIFINGCTIDNKIYWRDKIRYLINNNLVEDFIKYHGRKSIIKLLNRQNFYKKTKSPEINSRLVDGLCDKYFLNKYGEIHIDNYCIKSIESLITDPLVSYGNHSYHHYVLSSLTKDAQEEEIKKNHSLLKNISNKSKIFSIPFGGPNTFNSDTIKILKKYGYIGILYSQDKINIVLKNNKYRKVFHGLERFMAPTTKRKFHRFLPKVFFRSYFSSHKTEI